MDKNLTFSHVENERPHMVDVSHKGESVREAIAVSMVKMPSFVTEYFKEGELNTKKGPVFHTAIIAGTMAVKNTPLLIPLCHSLIIDNVHININIVAEGLLKIECRVKSFGRTGVEMEALIGASIAALTVYDMCKSLSFDIEIIDTKLIKKVGGKSDRHQHDL